MSNTEKHLPNPNWYSIPDRFIYPASNKIQGPTVADEVIKWCNVTLQVCHEDPVPFLWVPRSPGLLPQPSQSTSMPTSKEENTTGPSEVLSPHLEDKTFYHTVNCSNVKRFAVQPFVCVWVSAVWLRSPATSLCRFLLASSAFSPPTPTHQF